MVNGGTVLPDLKEFRIPIEYLARLLSAGNTSEVEKALMRQLALREFRRLERVEGRTDEAVLQAVGLTVKQARHMHRLLSLAHFHERFVIATARTEDTANAPYLERGFTGYDLLSPGASPNRRTEFHGNKMGVGS
jgi:nitrate reductase beta subunit